MLPKPSLIRLAALTAMLLATCTSQSAQSNLSDLQKKAELEQSDQELRVYFDAVTDAEKLNPADSRLAIALENLGFYAARHANFAISESALARAVAVRQQLGERSTREVRNDRLMLGGVYRDDRKDEEAQKVFLEALTEARDSRDDDFYLARCLSVLGHFYAGRGDYDEAEPYFLGALKVLESAKPFEDQNLSEALSNIVLLYRNAQRPAEAVPYLMRQLEIERKRRGADSVDVARELSTLADVYLEAGQLPEAETTSQQALVIYTKNVGPESSAAAAMELKLADIAVKQQNYARAEQIYRALLKNPSKSPGENEFRSTQAIRPLANVYMEQKKYGEAESLLEQLLKSQASEPVGSGFLLGTAEQLGPVYVAEGKLVEAETLYKTLVEQDKKALPKGHLATIASLNDLAEFYAETNRYEESDRVFQETIAEFGDVDSNSDGLTLGNLAIVMGNYARLLTKMGRSDDAAKYERESQNILKRITPKPLQPQGNREHFN